MPTVSNSIIASFVKSYYTLVTTLSGKFRIGLNMSSSTLLTNTSCSSTSIPGCVDASYSGQTASGSFTATFTASFTPSSNATLTSLGMATLISGSGSTYQTGIIDMSNISAQISGGTPYSITFEHKIIYPTTI